MKILVAGNAGQVAQSFAALRASGRTVVALGRPDLDLTVEASVERAIERHAPDVIVNAAAYTAVDRAETDAGTAFAVNRDGPAMLARLAARYDLPFVHLSTDYVFSGEKCDPYVEGDPVGPLGVYGRSKLAGEEAVLETHPGAVVLRTAWVYSPYGQNFLKTMLRLAGERDVVRVVADQRGTPTYAPDIAAAILTVLDQMIAAPADAAPCGVFHMVASGETDWASFAEAIFAESARHGGRYARVERITTADYPTLAKRPANSRLSSEKFMRTFDYTLPDWRCGVRRCVEALGLPQPTSAVA